MEKMHPKLEFLDAIEREANLHGANCHQACEAAVEYADHESGDERMLNARLLLSKHKGRVDLLNYVRTLVGFRWPSKCKNCGCDPCVEPAPTPSGEE